VGFGLTLDRLVGSVQSETAPATVGGEGGGAGEQAGRPANVHAREGPRGAGGGYYGA
jgi:hypothetical protein